MIITPRKQDETGRMYALRILRQNIISNELKPGTLISENETAQALGLSRVPVREAFIELSHSKIIEILPQRGSRISLIDLNMVEESNFFRKTLECAIVKLACETLTEKELLELEANVKLQEFYLENPSPEHLMRLDNEFHEMLFTFCHKERCHEMVVNMGIHFDRIRTLALTTVKDLKIVNDHRLLLDALRERDCQKAEEIITKHLNRFQLDEQLIREMHPEYFVEQ